MTLGAGRKLVCSSVTALALIACGADAPAPEPSAVPLAPPPSATSAPTTAVTETSAPAESPVPAAAAVPTETIPVGPELDLLHAVRTRVAVSSAYRDEAVQVGRLVDGDLETAWNSRTGDLTGAWIEFDVPADAHVRAIAITPGFTHVTPRADLFTGNHRITRVRVSRDGTVLGEHDLDGERRELLEVPVNAAGGRFRLAVLATTPGSREDWRETCVSELRVLGTSASAQADEYTPVTSIGPLTGSSSDAASELAADEAMDEELDAEMASLNLEAYEEVLEDWIGYVAGLGPDLDTSDMDASPDTLARQASVSDERRAIFTRAVEILEDGHPERAAAARTQRERYAGLWAGRGSDLASLLDGYDALAGSRCAPAHRVHVRAQSLRSLLETHLMMLELDADSGLGPDGRRLRAAERAALREQLASGRAFLSWMGSHGVRESAASVSAERRRELLEGTSTPPSALMSDWESLRSEIEHANRACGG